MSGKPRLLLLALGFLLLHGSTIAGAGDWASCNEALKKLHNAATGADFLAHETLRKQRLMRDSQRLANQYSGFEEINMKHRREYQRHVDGMEGALAKLQVAMFEVELACQRSLPSRPQPGKARLDSKQLESMCLKLKNHTRNMPPGKRLELCERVRFPGDCKKCLKQK